MNSKKVESGDSFERSSEQAARLVGQFVNMANSFGQSVRESMNTAVSEHAQHNDALKQAGSYVRRMRTAAGYSVEDFAEAMGAGRAFGDNITKAENGEAPFPREWLEKAATVLGAKDPVEFYSNFRDCYPEEKPQTDGNRTRAQQLAALFEDDTALAHLTDAQFTALLQAVQQHYRSARDLIDS
jgi:transcriptional regulator with XRE-family HTH domain